MVVLAAWRARAGGFELHDVVIGEVASSELRYRFTSCCSDHFTFPVFPKRSKKRNPPADFRKLYLVHIGESVRKGRAATCAAAPQINLK